MSGEEGSFREIWAALSLISRRLDELLAAVGRHATAEGPPRLSGEPLDEAARAALAPLRSLLAVGTGIAAPEALLLAVDRVIHRAGADCAAIFLVGSERELEVAAHRGFGADGPRAQRDEGVVGRALADRESVRGTSPHREQDPLMREHGLERTLAIPIGVTGQAPIAVLLGGRRRPVDFGVEALEVMTLLADRLGFLLGGPPAVAEPIRDLSSFGADLDLGRTSATVAREAAGLLDAPAVAVLLPGQGGVTLAAGVGLATETGLMDPTTGAIAAVLRTLQPWTPSPGERDEALSRLLGSTPQLVVPLLAGDRAVALLAAGAPHRLTPTALDPLQPAAGTAIRNARLYTEAVSALAEVRAVETPAPTPTPGPARDFTSLLVVVLGRLTAVRERIHDAAVARELDVAEEAAWRAVEAVRGLLGFAPGHRAAALAPLDVGGVLRAAIEQARSRWVAGAGPSPAVRLELEPMPPVRGSAEDLQDAFDRILENAAEAGSPESSITVRARWDGGTQVEVLVEDHGAGMDETTRARALEPFFSTKGAGRLGLGLPVSQAILAQHRGDLEIRSAPGLGTTLRITLPTLASIRRPSVPPETPVARVLVVEDEVSVREALVEIVVREGHVALTAADMPDALATLTQQPIDVVITDLALPSGSGLEVARAAKRAHGGTPVILVTAWPGHLDRMPVEESGVDTVIEKPVGLPEVRAALGAALATRRAGRT